MLNLIRRIVLIGGAATALTATANPTAQPTVDLVGLLKAEVSPNAGAIPIWASNAISSASLRIRLGSPIAIETLFPARVASRVRNTDPNLPMNRLSRYVRLSFPSLTSAQAMRRILLANGLFEHVEIANAVELSFTAITVPDQYYSTVQTGNAAYSYGGVSMQKNPYGVSPRPSYLPFERASWPQEQTQWYLQAMKFKEAWELLGDDDFDSNPASGYYGTSNVAVLDSGIDPQCDPYFESSTYVEPPLTNPPTPPNCFDTSYHPSVLPNPTLGNYYAGAVRPPHQQLARNLRRLQSYAAEDSQSLTSYQNVTADIIAEPGVLFAPPLTYVNATVSPLGVEGNPVRRGFFAPATPSEEVARTGHGTHVAGLIAAGMDTVGTVGTCPTCSLNYFQVVAPQNDQSLSNAANQMITLAARNGVQVMNMSFTGSIRVDPGTEESGAESTQSVLSTALYAASDREIFMVASAGNDFNPFQSTAPPTSSVNLNLPASHPKVIAAAGTMAQYSGNPSVLSSMLSWSERAVGSRCGPTDKTACGTAFTDDINKKLLYAPASRILSTMYGTWIEMRAAQGSSAFGLAGCTNELFPAAVSRGPSAVNYPTYDSRYGMCTGTSMSAPILSGLAGLLRSANPLLSIDATYVAMQNGATQVVVNSQDSPGAVNTVQPSADKSVEKVLGQFKGSLASNRLTPLFAVRSSVRDATIPHVDWLYSSKPQVLHAAMLGELYFTHPLNEKSGTRQQVNYDSSITLPPVAGFAFGTAVTETRGRTSFYVFATQRRPLAADGSERLVPLLRLATDSPLVRGACDGRKHTYATPGSVISGVDTQTYFSSATRPRCQFNQGTNSAVPPAANAARYAVVATEGFIFSPNLTQPNGTVALYLRYNSGADSYAMVTETDVNRPEYVGYAAIGQNETLLGYVYENDAVDVAGTTQTSDGDEWPANWELAAGLNADRADSDCDGSSDSAEYPLAGLPISDPVVNTCVGASIDSYAVAAAPANGAPQARATKFRLRNYTSVSQTISFDVEYAIFNTMPVTPNFGSASCNLINSSPMHWKCTLAVAPAAAGNLPIEMSTDCTLAMKTPVVHVSITSADGYQVNNYASRNLCQ